MLQRFLIGCLGGFTVVFLQFFNQDLYFEFSSLVFLIGYAFRVIVLTVLGGVGASIYSNENDFKKLFQLGLSLPALLLAVTPAQPTLIKKAPAHVPSLSTAESAVTVARRAGDIPITPAFFDRGWAEEPGKPEQNKEQEGRGEEQTGDQKQFIRGLTGRGTVGTGLIGGGWIFSAVVLLTVFSAVANLYLATLVNTTQQALSVMEGFGTTWKLGFGAIVGLLGGSRL